MKNSSVEKQNSANESQLRRCPEVLQQWQAGQEPGPMAIEVGCVRGCNQRCVHCGFQQYDAYGDQIIMLDNRDAFDSFLRDFAELGGRDVFFAGNGEPLINPNLGHWAMLGRELGLAMQLSTNGILLDDRRRESVLRGMRWIKLSVGGGDAETYSRVHGGSQSDYDRLRRNLAEAAGYRDQNQLDCELIILFILYDLNWQTMDGMVQLLRESGADRLIMRKASLDADMNKKQPWDDIRQALMEYDGQDRIEIRWDTFGEATSQLGWQRCDGVYFRTNMDHEGNLYTCARHFYQNSIYGNILDSRFRDIWHSAHKREVMEQAAAGREKRLCGRMCQAALDNRYLDALRKGTL